jgi:hypothetical protein
MSQFTQAPCPHCHGIGWLCEEHEIAWEPGIGDAAKAGCPGPGVPCTCNPNERMPPGTRILSSIYDEEPLEAPPMQPPCAGKNCGSTNPLVHSAECREEYARSAGIT